MGGFSFQALERVPLFDKAVLADLMTRITTGKPTNTWFDDVQLKVFLLLLLSLLPFVLGISTSKTFSLQVIEVLETDG